MNQRDVAAVFWGELEAAARLKEESGAKINLDALQAYSLAYLAVSMDDVRELLSGIEAALMALRGI